MLDLFRFDFGYGWPFTLGHALVFLVCAALTALAWKRGWPRWITAITGVLALWGLAGAMLMFQLSLPMALPTEAFLRSGEGRVLDLGAGSGRSTMMVLRGRPRTKVTTIDLYSGYWGIEDNTPNRLLANARAAGAQDRVEVTTGDMRAMPFVSASFDGAVSAFAIDHLRSDGVSQALSEVARVLRPQGEFLLVIVNIDWWTSIAFPMMALHGHGYFGHRQDPARWTRSLSDAGFEVVEHGTSPMSQYFLCRKKSAALVSSSSAKSAS